MLEEASKRRTLMDCMMCDFYGYGCFNCASFCCRLQLWASSLLWQRIFVPSSFVAFIADFRETSHIFKEPALCLPGVSHDVLTLRCGWNFKKDALRTAWTRIHRHCESLCFPFLSYGVCSSAYNPGYHKHALEKQVLNRGRSKTWIGSFDLTSTRLKIVWIFQ